MMLVLLLLMMMMVVLRRMGRLRSVLGQVDFVGLVIGKVVVVAATLFNVPVSVAGRVRGCIEIMLHVAP